MRSLSCVKDSKLVLHLEANVGLPVISWLSIDSYSHTPCAKVTHSFCRTQCYLINGTLDMSGHVLLPSNAAVACHKELRCLATKSLEVSQRNPLLSNVWHSPSNAAADIRHHVRYLATWSLELSQPAVQPSNGTTPAASNGRVDRQLKNTTARESDKRRR